MIEADIKSTAFLDVLESLGPELPAKAVLYPCTDATVRVVSENRDRLAAWYHVVLPAPEVVETLLDKSAFAAYAEKAGLPVPATAVVRDRDDAEQAARTLTFPVILKPSVKSRTWEANTTKKVLEVDSPSALLAAYDEVAGWADSLTVQEWVVGGDDALYSCNCYFDASATPLAAFVARKLRQWPPHTGTSSLGEECRNDEVLAETVRLFRGVGYRGLGYVEMKRDARTGRHVIIEPNIGRPTGRSAIAERGGVELLYTMYCDALGLPLPTQRTQRYVGVKWVDLRRDTQSAVYYWRRGELTLREWWISLRGRKAHAVVSLRDPLPFCAELAYAARRFAVSPPAAKQVLPRSFRKAPRLSGDEA